MGNRGSQRRNQKIKVEKERRVLADRRVADIDVYQSNAATSGYDDLKVYANGNYKSFIVKIDTFLEILGKKVKLLEGATVHFFENGNIKNCVLAASSTFSVFGTEAKVLKGHRIEFYENGEFKMLTLDHQNKSFFGGSKNWEYRGEVYKPSMTLKFSATGEVIEFKSKVL